MSSKLKQREKIQNDILDLRQNILTDKRFIKASKKAAELKKVAKKAEKKQIKYYKRDVDDVCKSIDYCFLRFTKIECVQHFKGRSNYELGLIYLKLEEIKQEIDMFGNQFGSNIINYTRQLSFKISNVRNNRMKLGVVSEKTYHYAIIHYVHQHNRG